MRLTLPDGITTLSEATAAGFTHLSLRCCRIVDMPFGLLRRPPETSIGEIAEKLRCSRCGGRPKSIALWAQHLSEGYVREYPGAGGWPKPPSDGEGGDGRQ